MSGIIVAVTGHRPPKLGLSWKGDTERDGKVLADARLALRQINPLTVISGMALGIDQVVAYAAVLENIAFTAAIPFPGQESRWPKAKQYEYKRLLLKAEDVVYVSEEYHPYAFQLRNIWMVDHADLLLAYWDGSPGGTGNCVKYAQSKNVPIHNRVEEWAKLQKASTT